MSISDKSIKRLPGLDCGLCGSKTCLEFAITVDSGINKIEKCIHLSPEVFQSNCNNLFENAQKNANNNRLVWTDYLQREFDFILDSNEYDIGPREIIQPFNPMLIKELNIKKGDSLIGRPMGMSCGCPVTHCGTVIEADQRNGVIVWCITGPLKARNEGFIDIGYYVAHAYEGVVNDSKEELVIGKRYWFMPRCCMLQWRHSGLINTITKLESGAVRIRIEGLYIG